MPTVVDASKRLQILTLRKAGNTFPQIAKQVGVHEQTAMRVFARYGNTQTAPLAAKIASKERILERMSTILESADKTTDSIAAGKLIALMQGYLTPEQGRAAQVNINMLGGSVDISAMEKEYEALRAPTTHALSVGDTQVSTNANDALISQPSGNSAPLAAGGNLVAGVEPPIELESNTLSSSTDFPEIFDNVDDKK